MNQNRIQNKLIWQLYYQNCISESKIEANVFKRKIYIELNS